MKGEYLDLLVTNGDLVLDAAANPLTIDQRDSIAQDIKHMVIESGLLVEIVAERDPEKRSLNLLRIERQVDLDVRIVPGTAKIIAVDIEHYYVTATTVDYGPLNIDLNGDR